jgi:hypothetical protein
MTQQSAPLRWAFSTNRCTFTGKISEERLTSLSMSVW